MNPSEEQPSDGNIDGIPSRAPDSTRDTHTQGNPARHRPAFWARATGRGRIYQSQGPMNVAERDLHQHFEDGVHRTRKVEPGAPAGKCPYPGLVAFDTDQAHLFFGRGHVTQRVLDRLEAGMRQGGAVMVAAPSGAGKSSMLRAGVLAAVARGSLGIAGSDRWPRAVFTPSDRPLEALAASLARAVEDDGQPWSAAVTDGPAACVLRMRSVLRERDPGGDGTRSRWVLVVDQLEELFTQCRNEVEREQFITLLHGMSEPGDAGVGPVALVLYGVRSDFLTACADFAHLRAANDNGLLMGPMSEDELRAAILFPARREGMEVEPGLVGILLGDLGEASNTDGPDRSAGGTTSGRYEAGRLPLLAHALRMTWQQSPGSVLTVDGYAATGGIARALADTADRTYQVLKPAGRRTARVLFLSLVRLGDGTEDTRKRLAYTDLLALSGDSETAATVIEEFTRARLLTRQEVVPEASPSDHDGSTVEITHDVLLRAWPRLRTWLGEDRDGNLLRQRVEEAAAIWDQARRDTNLLYRGSRLDEALDRRPAADGGGWTPLASEFLTAGRRQQQRATKIRRGVVAVLSVLALVASTAAAIAFDQRGEARKQTRTAVTAQHQAQSRQLAAESTNLAASDPDRASRLAVEAWRTSPTREAASALYTAPDRLLRKILDGAHGVQSVAVSPDGQLVATGSEAGFAGLWDTKTGRPQARFPADNGSVNTVAFSPDGKELAVGSGTGLGTGITRLWDLTSRKVVASTQSDTGHVYSVAFSPDGKTLATGGSAGVSLWDTEDGHLLRTIGGGYSYAVAFSPDGKTIGMAAGNPKNAMGTQGSLCLWDVKSNKLRVVSYGHGQIYSIAFSSDSRTLAASFDDDDGKGSAHLWDVKSGKLDKTLPSGDGFVNSVAFSADGHTLATGFDSINGVGSVQLWDTATSELRTTLPTGDGNVDSVAFSPDGKTLVSGTGSGIDIGAGTDSAGPGSGGARIWNTDVARLSSRLPVGDSESAALSSDGKSLAIENGGVVHVSRPDHGGADAKLPVTGAVDWMAFTPDARTLAILTEPDDSSAAVILWSMQDGTTHKIPADSEDIPDFSSDGRLLALSDGADTTRLWAVEGGTPNVALRSTKGGVAAFAPNGETIASYDRSKRTIRFWNAATGQAGARIPSVDGDVKAIALSPDGRTVTAGTETNNSVGATQLWDVRRRTLKSTLQSNDRSVEAVEFSPDGKTLAVSIDDRLYGQYKPGAHLVSIHLWDVATEALRATLPEEDGGVDSMEFGRDGRSLAVTADSSAQLWNVEFPGPSGSAASICSAIECR